MIKQILIVVVLVVIFNAIFVFSGGLELLRTADQKEETPPIVSADIVDVFRFTLEDEVVKKVGQPIEGFRPKMYMQVFPGLVETDFDGVKASLGVYKMQEGALVFILDETKLIHSAAKAVDPLGYTTLLQNISNRIGIDLTANGTITDIMRSLVSEG